MSEQDILDIVNEYDEVIGSDTRDNVHNNGLLHREIVVWIFNDNGEIAMQKRSKGKIFFPGLWSASTSGHVDFGDSYISTAIRELEEETSIKAREEDLIFIDKIYISYIFSNEARIYKNNIFTSVYAYKFKNNIDKLRIEKGEAEEFKWFKIDELLNSDEEERNKNFVPTIYNNQIQNILKKAKELFIEN
ncbi:MAG: NUDIX domain-containing protein [Patescibacteria group bacterium]|nr:NUDIX domain-containing protein [Patescibacteria group bacterium]MDD4304404.1 NUDIX domain-containing protein [Patescibacteria group bacterium]MDD4695427.1 NUDIX domain-containing protein [Patescibacteria group bacterium]